MQSIEGSTCSLLEAVLTVSRRAEHAVSRSKNMQCVEGRACSL